jgi:hypothetical protein
MRRSLLIAIAGTAFWLGWSEGGARAQTPPPGAQPPPANSQPRPRHGLLGRRHTGPTAGSLTPIPGGIIANKRTHVYHLAGDKGKLPAEKNRVYFHNEAEAQAAGFHAARKRGTGTKSSTRSKRGTQPAAPAPPSNQ